MYWDAISCAGTIAGSSIEPFAENKWNNEAGAWRMGLGDTDYGL